MLKSMTAYGRGAVEKKEGSVIAEIQSVNRKFLDLNLNLPKEFSSFETEIRKWVTSKVTRGQVNIRISASFTDILPIKIRPNIALAKEIKLAWDQISAELSLNKEEFSLNLLAQEADLFAYEENLLEKMHGLEFIKEAVDIALDKFLRMKEVEGAAIEIDIIKRIDLIDNLTKEISTLAPEAMQSYQDKLTTRLQEFLSKEKIPFNAESEQRLMQEVALYADRIDIAEETLRLNSHLEQMRNLLKKREPVGKTFEFLLQELNREANTLTAKSQDLKIVRLGLEIKGEIEKIREQIQNIE